MINNEIEVKVELISEEERYIIYYKSKDIGEIYFNYKGLTNEEVEVKIFICYEYYEKFKKLDRNMYYLLLSKAIKYNNIFLKGSYEIELSTGEDVEVLEVGKWRFVKEDIEFNVEK